MESSSLALLHPRRTPPTRDDDTRGEDERAPGENDAAAVHARTGVARLAANLRDDIARDGGADERSEGLDEEGHGLSSEKVDEEGQRYASTDQCLPQKRTMRMPTVRMSSVRAATDLGSQMGRSVSQSSCVQLGSGTHAGSIATNAPCAAPNTSDHTMVPGVFIRPGIQQKRRMPAAAVNGMRRLSGPNESA